MEWVGQAVSDPKLDTVKIVLITVFLMSVTPPCVWDFAKKNAIPFLIGATLSHLFTGEAPVTGEAPGKAPVTAKVKMVQGKAIRYPVPQPMTIEELRAVYQDDIPAMRAQVITDTEQVQRTMSLIDKFEADVIRPVDALWEEYNGSE